MKTRRKYRTEQRVSGFTVRQPRSPLPRPKFDANREDTRLIIQIAKRAVSMAMRLGFDYDMLTATMDIEACHCNGSPLQLSNLLATDDGTFGHDVFGIRRHINRETGRLGDCFVPRTAAYASLAHE